MKLEKSALIAEIVGSFAIVLTLIVLIIEVRGNTTETRSATQANIAARLQAIPMAVATNAQWADVFRRGSNGGDLSPTEELQFTAFIVASLRLTEESYLAHRDGQLSDEVWQTRFNFALNLLMNSERARENWEGFALGGTFVPGFIDSLDRALADRSGE